MKRLALIALAGLVIVASLAGQESILPVPADEIETILDLLDAVDAAQIVVLESPEAVTEANVEELRQLVTVAEDIGAEDLAARLRTLIMLATLGGLETPAGIPPVQGGLTGPSSEPLARDTQTFRRWVNVGATAGATALGMSAVFYYLAERNYQAWIEEMDPTLKAQLYRAWQGYDILGLGLGAATLATVGVGMPLVFALTPPSTTLATSPEPVTYTPAGREAELERLYAERGRIVERLNSLNTHEERRTLLSRIALGVGAAGTIAGGTFFYLAEQAYDLYLAATEPADAETLGKRVTAFDLLAVGSAGLGGAGFGFAATVAIATPGRAALERDLERVNAAIIRVRSSRTIDAPDPVSDDSQLSRRERRAAEKAAAEEAAAQEAAE